MDASDLACGEVMSLRTTILGQRIEIRELHAADRRRQIVTSEMLRADHKRFTEIRGLRTADRTQQQQLIQTLIVMQSLQRQELALLCGRMFPKEFDKIERYIGSLPDMIHGSVVASKPKTMQEAFEIETELMDKKIRTFLNVKQRVKGSLRIPQEALKTNNNNRTRGRTLARFTLQHLVKRSSMGDLNPYALNAIITMTVHVKPT
uniref:Reverse transcriptase domain-containing protein n=1 Tax=Tanacetum cinerariifolium TaxID=118510 RepID=A0A6L2NCX2_TANCI|nr:hypothetical protein [Tanacetum cinerariifolium]